MSDKIIIGGFVLLVFLAALVGTTYKGRPSSPGQMGFETFASEEEFKSYIEESESYYSGYSILGGTNLMQARTFVDTGIGTVLDRAPADVPKAEEGEGAGEPTRVSETTVQVLGIDEPDIVKTDGRNIYFSPERYWRGDRNTKVIKAWPAQDLEVLTKIGKSGRLLIYNNVLIIFSQNRVYGYDVSNPDSPEEKWDIEINGSMVDARLYNGKVYMVSRNNLDYYHPCPIRPIVTDGMPVVVGCIHIYRPTVPVPVDTTYNAVVFDPGSGDIESTVSFVGSTSNSVIYMSKNGIYATYTYTKNPLDIMYGFFKENDDLFPQQLVDDIGRVREYDISDQAKMTELQILLERWQRSLSKEERLRIQNEMNNRMDSYYSAHMRELEKTGVVKIGLDNFEVLATGEIPGRPLNQFSLDEFKGKLRVATTVGRWSKSENDVYVLDENLNELGALKGLGKTERIYSVRFLGDRGYVVTFRETDPFYVLDLSNPANPEMKGELKIPGYSSYLHPIEDNTILGIGKEGSNVKISMFDVSDPSNPTEIHKYILDEYWSDILNTHHAFLLDKDHSIFFLPGSKGGYIFSYENNQLEMVKAVSTQSARRAVYINDYLYIIADTELTVLSEIDWSKVNHIEFEDEYGYGHGYGYPEPLPRPIPEEGPWEGE